MVIKIRYVYKIFFLLHFSQKCISKRWILQSLRFWLFASLNALSKVDFSKVDFTVATLLALCFAERFIKGGFLKGGFYSRYAFCSTFRFGSTFFKGGFSIPAYVS
jgi:hypothetical protein